MVKGASFSLLSNTSSLWVGRIEGSANMWNGTVPTAIVSSFSSMFYDRMKTTAAMQYKGSFVSVDGSVEYPL